MRLDEKHRYKFRKVWSTWENFSWMLQDLFEKNGITFNGTAGVTDSIVYRLLYSFSLLSA